MELKNQITINKYLGLYTSKPSHLIPDFYLANSLNMSVGSFGFLSPFKQYSEFLALSGSDSLTIVNSITMKKGDGQEVPIIAVENSSNVLMYWYNAVAGELELLQTLTTGTVPSFSGKGYNTSTSDGIYWSNGVDNYTYWSGAIGTIASNTSTIITLNAVTGFAAATNLGFAASGSVRVNGVDYAYTGLSGWTLTGCTALPTFTVNEGVAQIVSEDAAITKFHFLTVADGRVFGARKNSIRLYYSEVGVGGNFTSADTPNGPGFRDFVEGNGAITGLAAIREYVIVGKEDMVRYFKIEYPSSTTKTHKSEIIIQGDKQGPAYHHSIVNVTTDFTTSVYYLPVQGAPKRIFVNDQGSFQFDDIGEVIRPSMKKAVNTDSRAIYFEKERIIMFSYKKDSDSTKKDRIVHCELVKDDNEMIRHAWGFMDWGIGGFFDYDGDIYFGSSFEGKLFKAFDGYTKAGNPATTLATLKRYDFGAPLKQKTMDYLAVVGYIAPGQLIHFQLDYDTEGTRATVQSSLAATETDFIIEPSYNTIGAFEMGTEPIGGTIDDIDELNVFQVYFRLPRQNPFNIQLTIWGDGVDADGVTVGNRWSIEQILIEPMDAMRQIPKDRIKYFK